MPEAHVAQVRQVLFRLVRDHDKPVSHEFEEPYEFGLQDNKGEIIAGAREAIGRFVFDFSLKVKSAADGRPTFTGRFASGPPSDRFVYLSWRSILRGVYLNRLKARLSSIDCDMISTASDGGRRPARAWRSLLRTVRLQPTLCELPSPQVERGKPDACGVPIRRLTAQGRSRA